MFPIVQTLLSSGLDSTVWNVRQYLFKKKVDWPRLGSFNPLTINNILNDCFKNIFFQHKNINQTNRVLDKLDCQLTLDSRNFISSLYPAYRLCSGPLIP